MKRIIFVISMVALLSSSAGAQETRTQATASLMGLGMPGPLASQVAGLATGLGIVTADMFVGTGVVVGATARAANVTSASGTSAIYALVSPASNDIASFIANGASASGPIVDFLKTRATSGAQASTIVQSGDVLGRFRFLGANGTGYDVASEIQATVGGTPGASTDMPGSLIFKTSPDGSVTPTTALTIESDQDLLLTGDLYLADGQNLAFTGASGANTACDTTCTGGCVAGWDTGTSVFVACTNAIADTCLCTK